MAATTALISLVCLALSATANPLDFEFGEHDCDFSDLNVEYAVNQLLARLPKEREITKTAFVDYDGFFETGRMQATGLDTLKRYGPLERFCVNGTRVVQFDIVSDGGARLVVPWRSCSGHEGTITLVAGYSRFTVQLNVEGSGSDARLQYMGPNLLVATEDLDLVFEGAGPVFRTAVEIISKFLDPFLREVWKSQFFRQFNPSLQQILPVGINEV
ncbi:uncharacterized protein LOC144139543 [Haemaphysalis longicornis]